MKMNNEQKRIAAMIFIAGILVGAVLGFSGFRYAQHRKRVAARKELSQAFRYYDYKDTDYSAKLDF